MVDFRHPSLSVVRQCVLLGVSRSSVYYRAVGVTQEDLELMKEIDKQYLDIPFFGSRRMAAWLRRRGYWVNRKGIRRLMRVMGLRGPSTGVPGPASLGLDTRSTHTCCEA